MAQENRAVAPAIVAVIFLALGLIDRWPYGFYTVLRVVVCVSAVYLAVLARELRRFNWVWLMAILALLFNPLVPVRLPRAPWQIIDLIAAGIFLASLLFLRGRK